MIDQRSPGSVAVGERTAFVTIVALATWLGEEFASDGLPSFWFGRSIAGVPIVYPAVAALLGVAFVFLPRRGRYSIVARLKATGLWKWIVGAWVALAATLAMALLTAAPELFADWRNFVLMILVIVVLAPWLSTRPWRHLALTDFVIAYGGLGVFVLVRWLLGGGPTIFDQRVTVFYWPHLLLMTYSAVVGASIIVSDTSTVSRLRLNLIRASATVTTVVIMLSFRRSFWLAWGAGMLVVFIVAWRRRQLQSRNIMAVGVTVAIGFIALFVAMGTDVVLERFSSFLPNSTSDYSATNEDHVNDMVEAFEEIEKQPILGLGIGRYYETARLADGWKETSFEVHNAVLHAWLKFGVVGMVVFIGFHLQWIRHHLTVASSDLHSTAVRTGMAAYLVAQLANTVAQTWVYGRVQMAIHMGVLLAIVLANTRLPVPATAPRIPIAAPRIPIAQAVTDR